MAGFSKCPNCAKQSVEVPLRQDGDSMTCPFCESVYEKSY
jgi:uncharacterized Zn-finger protein